LTIERTMKHRNNLFFMLMAAVLMLSFVACNDDGAQEAPPEPFSFVIISDTHVRLPDKPDDVDYDNQGNIDNLTYAVSRINAEMADADFVAVTGDLVGALFSEDPADYGVDIPNPAETYKEIMDGLHMPYHSVLGNHDYQRDYDAENGEGISVDNLENIEAVWEKVLGIKPYYSMVYEKVRLIFLNPNRGDARTIRCPSCDDETTCTGSLDGEQAQWFAEEMEKDEPVIILMHHPIYSDRDDALFSMLKSFFVRQEDAFYDILESHKEKVLGIFVGHGHMWERDTVLGTIPVYETGAIGDGNRNKDNIHVIDVDPLTPAITVTIAREGAMYFCDEFGTAD